MGRAARQHSLDRPFVVERGVALNRGTVRSPLFKPTDAQAAALRARLARQHSLDRPFVVERGVALNRGTVRSPLFKPTDAQAAALRARLERLQQPATMLELLRSALLPAGFEPSAVVTCRQLTAVQDRVVLRVLTRADSGAEREYAVKIYCDDIVERIWSFTQTLADGVSAAVDQLGLPTAYVSQESALVPPRIAPQGTR